MTWPDGLVRELGEGACVALSQPVPLAALLRLLDGELADRLEHREPRLALDPLGLADEALLGQRRQPVEGIAALAAADALDLVEPRTADEHREASEELAVGLLEHVVAPRDRAAQGLLPSRKVARARRQQPEPIAQPAEHRLGSQDPDPRRGELDRQRQAVEADADLGDRRRVLVRDLEPGPHRPSALDEQRDRLVLGELRQRRKVGRVRQAERRNRVLLLARHLQRASAAGQDGEVRAGGRGARSPMPPPRAPARSCRGRAARASRPRWSMTRSIGVRPPRSARPSVCAIVDGTRSGSVIVASSTNQTPSG